MRLRAPVGATAPLQVRAVRRSRRRCSHPHPSFTCGDGGGGERTNAVPVGAVAGTPYLLLLLGPAEAVVARGGRVCRRRRHIQ
ncbi:Os12g0428700 [Oryza sativa Japonica Group]|uniref:Expressed protein n=2 Tax=Oryza sativa subsp. japonica TaxID=39947 RepID=Q0INM4_ORYSJ|nr:expressed protein [Oryza sativa Japonica Group]BAF29691.1 Os12g0428700 [Oryza sativa Japonica Group]BAG99201.1 unnamed protein product [Oryza sativa Japonica Group]|eukprot:NP_001066672.1 Os12g0428700 [Oryza sativa Japonica Group]